MTHIKARIITALAALLLNGCYQAQLRGGVADASIEVAPLRAPATAPFRTHSFDKQSVVRRRGIAEWNAYSPIQKSLWMGVFHLSEAGLQNDELYLVTASGGRETDYDQDLQLDAEPRPVRGSWHAILPGEHAGGFRNKVSLLTEACYQWLLDEVGGSLEDVSVNQVVGRLDWVAGRLVEDVNRDGLVNYLDILQWNPSFDRPRYRGDPQLLVNLNTAILLDFPEELRSAIAQDIVRTSPWQAQGVVSRLLDGSGPD